MWDPPINRPLGMKGLRNIPLTSAPISDFIVSLDAGLFMQFPASTEIKLQVFFAILHGFQGINRVSCM